MEVNDDECVCKGNWRNLVRDYGPFIGRTFIEPQTGAEYVFSGLIDGADDYYYLLYSNSTKNPTYMLSCVCDLFRELSIKD